MAITPSLRAANRRILGSRARATSKSKLPKLSIHLFMGVGGGFPRSPSPSDPGKDIRLGDVVVGPAKRTEAIRVVQ